jgi:uncharacterized membrane protein
MNDEPFSAMEALQAGFATFGEHAGHCVMVMAAVEGCCLLAAFTVGRNITVATQVLTQMDSVPPDTFVYAFIAVYLIVRCAAQVIVNKWLLMLHDGREMTMDELLGFDMVYQVPQMLRMMAASLVFSIYAVLGTLMLVVPGLLATSTLRFYKFLIVDKNADAVEGLRESYELSSHHKGGLVTFNILSGLVKLLGLAFFGIGYVPASAACGLAEAYAYRQLVRAYDENPLAQNASLN